MHSRPRFLRPLALALALLSAQALSAPALSDVVKVPRPAEGEFMGLYLKGQKVGFMFTQVTLSPKQDRVTAVTEMTIKARVGPTATSQRTVRDTRTYEAKPGGRLLGFVFEQRGDGGDQTLTATATPQGLRVVRAREGRPDDVKLLPASKEVVEDADQARVALFRSKEVTGTITDAMDLEHYKVVTTPGATDARVLGGVKTRFRKVVTFSEKEKVPTEAWVDEKGRMLEIQFGPTMTAVLEPPEVARRIDVVEVFGHTRVTLPRPLGPEARAVPGRMTLVVSGVPEKFRVDGYRQTYKALAGEKVEISVAAAPPKVRKPRPLADPNGGANLKSTLQVEADAPEVVALARQIAGDEKDAWAAAKKVSQWVNKNLAKDYGASSDSATDVLKEKRGDCTEHSLLAVSLLRALGIPAKRVDGLVYLVNEDKVPAFYWHEWVEAFVGEWTQLDPTFGQDVADAARLGFGEEGKAEITPLIGSMTVVEVR